MNIIELRKKNKIDLTKELSILLREQFKYRIAISSSEFTKVHLFKKVRKNIARVQTVISELKNKGNA